MIVSQHFDALIFRREPSEDGKPCQERADPSRSFHLRNGSHSPDMYLHQQSASASTIDENENEKSIATLVGEQPMAESCRREAVPVICKLHAEGCRCANAAVLG